MHPLQHINLEHDAQMYITWTWTVYICEHTWYWHCDILPNYWIDKRSLHAYYASICIVYSTRIQRGVHPKNLSRRLRIRAMEYSSNLLEQQHNIVQQSFFLTWKFEQREVQSRSFFSVDLDEMPSPVCQGRRVWRQPTRRIWQWRWGRSILFHFQNFENSKQWWELTLLDLFWCCSDWVSWT